MTLSQADIYVIKRLSSRVNVLPVVSRSDTMTNERLEEVKATIRRDLKKGGVQVGGILGQLDDSDEDEDEEEENSDEDEEDTRGPRTVVRIRSTRGTSGDKRHPLFNKRSRSRTRAALTDEDVDFELASIVFPRGVHSMRALFPFSIMSPDPVPIMRGSPGNTYSNGASLADGSPAPPSSYRRRSVFLDSGDHLKALRGKYTRNYRWGSVDVLSEFLETHRFNSSLMSMCNRSGALRLPGPPARHTWTPYESPQTDYKRGPLREISHPKIARAQDAQPCPKSRCSDFQ
jgi:hypothetical protein